MSTPARTRPWRRSRPLPPPRNCRPDQLRGRRATPCAPCHRRARPDQCRGPLGIDGTGIDGQVIGPALVNSMPLARGIAGRPVTAGLFPLLAHRQRRGQPGEQAPDTGQPRRHPAWPSSPPAVTTWLPARARPESIAKNPLLPRARGPAERPVSFRQVPLEELIGQQPDPRRVRSLPDGRSQRGLAAAGRPVQYHHQPAADAGERSGLPLHLQRHHPVLAIDACDHRPPPAGLTGQHRVDPAAVPAGPHHPDTARTGELRQLRLD